jgi:hypothetical protein
MPTPHQDDKAVNGHEGRHHQQGCPNEDGDT